MRMHHPLIGQPAPAISLPDSNGNTYNLEPSSAGVPMAIFFYPESGSIGCTKEACSFKDAVEKPTFKDTKVIVIGISPDPVEKQKAFVQKQGLNYPILSDLDGAARKAYSVNRGMYGLTASARITFVIDSEGVVRDAMDSMMNFGGHTRFVEKWITTLDAEAKATTVPPSATETAENSEVAAAPAQETAQGATE